MPGKEKGISTSKDETKNRDAFGLDIFSSMSLQTENWFQFSSSSLIFIFHED